MAYKMQNIETSDQYSLASQGGLKACDAAILDFCRSEKISTPVLATVMVLNGVTYFDCEVTDGRRFIVGAENE